MRKPNKPTLIKEEMTEEDWKEYFECREKYDVELSDEDIEKIKSSLLSDLGNQRKKDNIYKMYVAPDTALALKNTLGFKAIKKLNLLHAKRTYPDDF